MIDAAKEALVDEAMNAIGGGQHVILLVQGTQLYARSIDIAAEIPSIAFVEDASGRRWMIDYASIGGWRAADD